MSSFLVLSEGDTRNRWRDGQGTMAPWARRLGCVLACYAQIGRGRRERGERKETGERERGVRLVWRKGLSPEIGVKKDDERWWR
ncbi:hypothetical protein TNCV_2000661 [Trichonephila clavipes]|nr:hypothetical protein TNCV_2000661 [Trichonephila clavipes]